MNKVKNIKDSIKNIEKTANLGQMLFELWPLGIIPAVAILTLKVVRAPWIKEFELSTIFTVLLGGLMLYLLCSTYLFRKAERLIYIQLKENGLYDEKLSPPETLAGKIDKLKKFIDKSTVTSLPDHLQPNVTFIWSTGEKGTLSTKKLEK